MVVHLSFLHEKQLLMKVSLENQPTYANLLLGLIWVNYTPTRCVNLCQPVFIKVGTSVQRQIDLRFDKTKPAALKKWSCPFFKKKDQNLKLKASLQQADRRELTALVLVGFVVIATLCLKPWVAFTTFVPVKENFFFSLKKIFNVVVRRESSMHWEDTVHKTKATGFWKCGSASGRDSTKQPTLLNNISENIFLTKVRLQLSNS